MERSIDYESLRRELSWDVARTELGLVEGEPVNIGRICTDRIVEQGLGDKTALIHEDHAGQIRKFSFEDLKQFSNGWASFLASHV